MAVASCTPKCEYWVWNGDGDTFAEIYDWYPNLRQREGVPDVLEYFYPTSTWAEFPVGGVVVRMFPGTASFISDAWNQQNPTNAGQPVILVYASQADFEKAFSAS